MQEAISTKLAKSQDYNRGRVDWPDYFPFGDMSAAHILHGKSLRAVSLVSVPYAPNFEALEDTFKDLIVYAAMAWALKMIREPDATPNSGPPN